MMNWDYELNQWVKILRCNIFLVEQAYKIDQVYGDLIPEANPLYMDSDIPARSRKCSLGLRMEQSF
ncbi:hypothetical protein FMM74_006730 [Lachnospiraceae bacterium MD308]|nr:hypothetical protein [Lachnospiraceae bacterium MD308]